MGMQVLFGIVLMLVIVMFVFNGSGCNAFAGVLGTEKHFLVLGSAIKEIANSPDRDAVRAVTIKLNRDNAIIGFTKTAQEVLYDSATDYVFKRPSLCGTDIACVCFCRGKLTLQGNEIKCGKEELTCDDLNKIDFPAIIDGKAFNKDTGASYKFQGGFILQRLGQGRLEESIDSTSSVYVKRIDNNIVAVCTIIDECFP